MKKLFVLFLPLLSLLNYAQTFDDKMVVTEDELLMSEYNKDPSANALVLYEYGVSYLSPNVFLIGSEVHKKIKIFNKNGFEKGNISIVLYNNGRVGESINNIKASTYNYAGGKINETIIEKDQIFTEKFDGNNTIIKFTLPNLQEGSVIVYSYQKRSPFLFKFNEWLFQDDIPKIQSEYLTSIPSNWKYNTKLIGALELSKVDKTNTPKCIGETGFFKSKSPYCENIIYQINDIPAFISEGYLSSPGNYISRLDYELSAFQKGDGSIERLSTNWEIVDKQIKESTTGELLKKKRFIKKLLPDDIKAITEPAAKAKAIYNFVQDKYIWNESNRSIHDNLKPLIKDGTGSIYEINSLLCNLLNINGLIAEPMLISTRANGLLTKLFPVITEFNYLIVKLTIEGKTILLDASNKYIPFGELPFKCLNQYGRVLNFNKLSYWQDIEVEKYSVRQHRVKLDLSKDDILYGTLDSNTTGYPSHSLRMGYFEDEEAYFELFKNLYNDISIEEHTVSTVKKNDTNFKEQLNISYEPEFIGQKIYFNPFIFKFFEENPFKLQERNYPIDFGYKDIYQYSMEIDLKDQLKVAEIPEPISLALPNKTGTLLFSITERDGKLTVYLKIKFDKAIYGAEYYEALKQFMNKVVEIQNNTVVVLQKL